MWAFAVMARNAALLAQSLCERLRSKLSAVAASLTSTGLDASNTLSPTGDLADPMSVLDTRRTTLAAFDAAAGYDETNLQALSDALDAYALQMGDVLSEVRMRILRLEERLRTLR